MNFVNLSSERQISINNLKINYKIFGDGNIPIILLHGWGIDSDKYIDTAQKLFQVSPKDPDRSGPTRQASFKFQVFIPDLPGFGKSDNPPKAWSVDDYVEFVNKFIGKTVQVSLRGANEESDEVMPEADPPLADNPVKDGLNTGLFRSSVYPELVEGLAMTDKKIVLIGHSFGGRIAIKFAAKYPEKLQVLILTGAAGIKHPPTLKQKIFFLLAKTGKIIFSLPIINILEKPAQRLLYRLVREKDYYQAQGVMKETFKKVIAEDLTPCLEKIKTPTLLIWGAKDKSTSLADAYIMKEKISAQGGSASGGENCKLKIVGEANHSLPYQKSEEFAKIVLGFTHTLKTKSNNNSI